MTTSRRDRTTGSRPAPPPSPGDAATADYVAAMTGELAKLSRRAGFGLLAYCLDIARLEALEQAQRARAASPDQ